MSSQSQFKRFNILQQLEQAIKKKTHEKYKSKSRTKNIQGSVKAVRVPNIERNQYGVSQTRKNTGQATAKFKLTQFKVKKHQNKKFDKIVSLVNYAVTSADKALKYVNLSSNFESQFAYKLYLSDRENLMLELNGFNLQQLIASYSNVGFSQQQKNHAISASGPTSDIELHALKNENDKMKKEIMILQGELKKAARNSSRTQHDVHNIGVSSSPSTSKNRDSLKEKEELLKRQIDVKERNSLKLAGLLKKLCKFNQIFEYLECTQKEMKYRSVLASSGLKGFELNKNQREQLEHNLVNIDNKLGHLEGKLQIEMEKLYNASNNQQDQEILEELENINKLLHRKIAPILKQSPEYQSLENKKISEIIAMYVNYSVKRQRQLTLANEKLEGKLVDFIQVSKDLEKKDHHHEGKIRQLQKQNELVKSNLTDIYEELKAVLDIDQQNEDAENKEITFETLLRRIQSSQQTLVRQGQELHGYHELKHEFKRAQKQIAQLSGLFDREQANNSRLEHELNVLKSKLKDTAQAKRQVEEYVVSLQKNKKQQQIQFEEMTDQLTIQEKTVAELQSINAQLQSQIKHLQSEMGQAGSDLTKFQQLLQQKQNQLTDLQQKMNDMEILNQKTLAENQINREQLLQKRDQLQKAIHQKDDILHHMRFIDQKLKQADGQIDLLTDEINEKQKQSDNIKNEMKNKIQQIQKQKYQIEAMNANLAKVMESEQANRAKQVQELTNSLVLAKSTQNCLKHENKRLEQKVESIARQKSQSERVHEQKLQNQRQTYENQISSLKEQLMSIKLKEDAVRSMNDLQSPKQLGSLFPVGGNPSSEEQIQQGKDQRQFQLVTQQLSQANIKIVQLQRAKAELEVRIQEAEEVLEKQRQQIERQGLKMQELKTLLTRIEGVETGLNEKLGAKDQQIKALQLMIQELKAQNANANAVLSPQKNVQVDEQLVYEQEIKIQRLQQENQKNLQNLHKLQQSYSLLENDNQKNLQRINSLQQSKSELLKDNQTKAQDFDQLKQSFNELQKQNQTKTQDFNTLKQSYEQLQKEYQKKVQEFRLSYEQLQKDNQTKSQELNTLKQSFENLQKQNQKNSLDLNRFKQSQDQLQKQNQKIRQSLHKLQEQYNNIQQQNQQNQQKLSKLQQQYNQLQNQFKNNNNINDEKKLIENQQQLQQQNQINKLQTQLSLKNKELSQANQSILELQAALGLKESQHQREFIQYKQQKQQQITKLQNQLYEVREQQERQQERQKQQNQLQISNVQKQLKKQLQMKYNQKVDQNTQLQQTIIVLQDQFLNDKKMLENQKTQNLQQYQKEKIQTDVKLKQLSQECKKQSCQIERLMKQLEERVKAQGQLGEKLKGSPIAILSGSGLSKGENQVQQQQQKQQQRQVQSDDQQGVTQKIDSIIIDQHHHADEITQKQIDQHAVVAAIDDDDQRSLVDKLSDLNIQEQGLKVGQADNKPDNQANYNQDNKTSQMKQRLDIQSKKQILSQQQQQVDDFTQRKTQPYPKPQNSSIQLIQQKYKKLINDLKQQLQNQQLAQSRYKEAMQVLQVNNLQVSNQAQQQEALNTHLKEEIQDLRDILKARMVDNDSLKDQVKQLKQQMEAAKREYIQNCQSIEEREIQPLREKLQLKQSELTAQKQKYQELGRVLQQTKQVKQEYILALENQNQVKENQYNSKSDQFECKLESMRKQIDSAQLKRMEFQAENKRLQNQLNKTTQELNKVTQQLNRVSQELIENEKKLQINANANHVDDNADEDNNTDDNNSTLQQLNKVKLQYEDLLQKHDYAQKQNQKNIKVISSYLVDIDVLKQQNLFLITQRQAREIECLHLKKQVQQQKKQNRQLSEKLIEEADQQKQQSNESCSNNQSRIKFAIASEYQSQDNHNPNPNHELLIEQIQILKFNNKLLIEEGQYKTQQIKTLQQQLDQNDQHLKELKKVISNQVERSNNMLQSESILTKRCKQLESAVQNITEQLQIFKYTNSLLIEQGENKTEKIKQLQQQLLLLLLSNKQKNDPKEKNINEQNIFQQQQQRQEQLEQMKKNNTLLIEQNQKKTIQINQLIKKLNVIEVSQQLEQLEQPQNNSNNSTNKQILIKLKQQNQILIQQFNIAKYNNKLLIEQGEQKTNKIKYLQDEIENLQKKRLGLGNQQFVKSNDRNNKNSNKNNDKNNDRIIVNDDNDVDDVDDVDDQRNKINNNNDDDFDYFDNVVNKKQQSLIQQQQEQQQHQQQEQQQKQPFFENILNIQTNEKVTKTMPMNLLDMNGDDENENENDINNNNNDKNNIINNNNAQVLPLSSESPPNESNKKNIIDYDLLDEQQQPKDKDIEQQIKPVEKDIFTNINQKIHPFKMIQSQQYKQEQEQSNKAINTPSEIIQAISIDKENVKQYVLGLQNKIFKQQQELQNEQQQQQQQQQQIDQTQSFDKENVKQYVQTIQKKIVEQQDIQLQQSHQNMVLDAADNNNDSRSQQQIEQISVDKQNVKQYVSSFQNKLLALQEQQKQSKSQIIQTSSIDKDKENVKQYVQVQVQVQGVQNKILEQQNIQQEKPKQIKVQSKSKGVDHNSDQQIVQTSSVDKENVKQYVSSIQNKLLTQQQQLQQEEHITNSRQNQNIDHASHSQIVQTSINKENVKQYIQNIQKKILDQNSQQNYLNEEKEQPSSQSLQKLNKLQHVPNQQRHQSSSSSCYQKQIINQYIQKVGQEINKDNDDLDDLQQLNKKTNKAIDVDVDVDEDKEYLILNDDDNVKNNKDYQNKKEDQEDNDLLQDIHHQNKEEQSFVKQFVLDVMNKVIDDDQQQQQKVYKQQALQQDDEKEQNKQKSQIIKVQKVQKAEQQQQLVQIRQKVIIDGNTGQLLEYGQSIITQNENKISQQNQQHNTQQQQHQEVQQKENIKKYLEQVGQNIIKRRNCQQEEQVKDDVVVGQDKNQLFKIKESMQAVQAVVKDQNNQQKQNNLDEFDEMKSQKMSSSMISQEDQENLEIDQNVQNEENQLKIKKLQIQTIQKKEQGNQFDEFDQMKSEKMSSSMISQEDLLNVEITPQQVQQKRDQHLIQAVESGTTQKNQQNNDFDEFDQMKSEKMSSSMLSQDGQESSEIAQKSEEKIQLPKNEVVRTSQKEEQNNDFDEFGQMKSENMSSSMLSQEGLQSAEIAEEKKSQPKIKDVATSQKDKQDNEFDEFDQMKSVKMSSSMISQEDLLNAEFAKKSQQEIDQPKNEVVNQIPEEKVKDHTEAVSKSSKQQSSDLDGFESMRSDKNQSSISHEAQQNVEFVVKAGQNIDQLKNEVVDLIQGVEAKANVGVDRKQSRQEQSDLDGFESMRQDRMSGSMISQEGQQNVEFVQKSEEKIDQPNNEVVNPIQKVLDKANAEIIRKNSKQEQSDLDGFKSMRSEKIQSSMLSQGAQQSSEIAKKADEKKLQIQEGERILKNDQSNDFDAFDQMKSERMSSSMISQEGQQSTELGQKSQQKIDQPKTKIVGQIPETLGQIGTTGTKVARIPSKQQQSDLDGFESMRSEKMQSSISQEGQQNAEFIVKAEDNIDQPKNEVVDQISGLQNKENAEVVRKPLIEEQIDLDGFQSMKSEKVSNSMISQEDQQSVQIADKPEEKIEQLKTQAVGTTQKEEYDNDFDAFDQMKSERISSSMISCEGQQSAQIAKFAEKSEKVYQPKIEAVGVTQKDEDDNDFDAFDQMKSEKMSSSMISQEGQLSSQIAQKSEEKIEQPKIEVVNQNQEAQTKLNTEVVRKLSKEQSSDLDGFESMKSEKMQSSISHEARQSVEIAEANKAEEKIEQPKNKDVAVAQKDEQDNDFDAFDQMKSEKMSSSMISQEGQQTVEFGKKSKEQIDQPKIKAIENTQQDNDFDAFGQIKSEKMSSSMISQEGRKSSQIVQKSKDKIEQPKNEVAEKTQKNEQGNDFDAFDQMKSENMSSSMISQEGQQSAAIAQKVEEKKDQSQIQAAGYTQKDEQGNDFDAFDQMKSERMSSSMISQEGQQNVEIIEKTVKVEEKVESPKNEAVETTQKEDQGNDFDAFDQMKSEKMSSSMISQEGQQTVEFGKKSKEQLDQPKSQAVITTQKEQQGNDFDAFNQMKSESMLSSMISQEGQQSAPIAQKVEEKRNQAKIQVAETIQKEEQGNDFDAFDQMKSERMSSSMLSQEGQQNIEISQKAEEKKDQAKIQVAGATQKEQQQQGNDFDAFDQMKSERMSGSMLSQEGQQNSGLKASQAIPTSIAQNSKPSPLNTQTHKDHKQQNVLPSDILNMDENFKFVNTESKQIQQDEQNNDDDDDDDDDGQLLKFLPSSSQHIKNQNNNKHSSTSKRCSQQQIQPSSSQYLNNQDNLLSQGLIDTNNLQRKSVDSIDSKVDNIFQGFDLANEFKYLKQGKVKAKAKGQNHNEQFQFVQSTKTIKSDDEQKKKIISSSGGNLDDFGDFGDYKEIEEEEENISKKDNNNNNDYDNDDNDNDDDDDSVQIDHHQQIYKSSKHIVQKKGMINTADMFADFEEDEDDFVKQKAVVIEQQTKRKPQHQPQEQKTDKRKGSSQQQSSQYY